MQNTNTHSRISIQVSLSGYSFKVEDLDNIVQTGWLGGEKFFTTPEFRRRYNTVRLSLLTPKCTIIPEQFFSSAEARHSLEDVVHLDPEDKVEYVRLPQLGAIMVFSNDIGETLSKAIAQTVLTEDGYNSRILPEMWYLVDAIGDCTEYNKILASYADGYLHLVIAQGKSLMLANIYKAPDFTTAQYFIFNALKKLQLNPEVSTVSFRTPITEEQEISLYRYFKAVERL